MKILFLDDDPNRYRRIQPFFIGHSYSWAKTANEAISLLIQNDYDIVFLDHDLLPCHYDDFSCEDGTTGHGVAHWLTMNKERFLNSMFIVHTQNPIGGPSMKKLLKTEFQQVYWIPFPELLPRIDWLF